MSPKRVLVWMSWWVDSAVSAYLLQQQWYEVVAWFMKNYADESNPNCHTRQDRNMAIKVSQHLGIKTFIIFDFRHEYHETIIKYIYDTYEQWLTPNPDILCNTEVKFKLFLEEWKKLGCDYIATGHYARIKQNTAGTYTLLKGKDTNKDQSYFLSGLNQRQLSNALFPLGNVTKPEVRKIAKEIALPNADRKDSQWLCFIGKVSMKDFLEEALPINKGVITDESGNALGEHDGVWFYTVGQRQWLGLAWGPWYVVKRDIKNNTLIVWPQDTQNLFQDHLRIKSLHRIAGEGKKLPLQVHAKIRYRQQDQACTIHAPEKQWIRIDFKEPQRAISPGQTIALYDQDMLFASGIISW